MRERERREREREERERERETVIIVHFKRSFESGKVLYLAPSTQVNRMSRSRRVLAIGGKHCDYGWTGSVFIHFYFL